MSRSLRAVFAVTIVTASFTCSDSGVPAPVRLADDLARAFCKRQFRCCSPAELGELAGARYTSEGECIAFARLQTRRDLAVLESLVESGHVTIDSKLAAACVAAYEQRDCNSSRVLIELPSVVPDVGQALAACPGILIGRVPEGSRCDIEAECRPGTHCAGACVTAGRVGEICNDSADCDEAAGLYCRGTDFVCARPQPEGQPCSLGLTNTGELRCAAGLRCEAPGPVCRRPPRAGDPCLQTPCDPDPALALSCNGFTGTCQTAGREGEACGAAALPPCAFALSCIPMQSDGIGTCGPPPAEGEPCTDKCASPAACDLFTGICKRPGTSLVGAPCAGNDECVTLRCQDPGIGNRICVPSGRLIVCGGSGVTPGGVMGAGGVNGRGGTFGAAGTNVPGGVDGNAGTTGAAGDQGIGGGEAAGTTGAGGVTGAGGT